MAPLTIGSFCSGVGGLDAGAADALTAYFGRPVRHAWFCEYSKSASAVLAERFPDAPNHGDLIKHDWSTAEPVDVLCMGVPCQPFSAAGKRKADGDERYLWPYAVAAMRRMRRLPRLVVFENVPNLVSIKGGEIWRTIQDDLMALGYRGRWRIAPAATVGAPHLRKRVVLVAVLDPGREIMTRSPVAYTKTGLPVLPIPLARDSKGFSQRTLVDAVMNLLPTPRTTEAHRVGKRGLADGYAKDLDLRTAVALLKTPTAQLAINGGSQHPDKRREGGHGPTLADEVEFLLPTPAVSPYGYNQGGAAGRVGERRYGLDGIQHLLPSPRASDGTNGGPNQRGSKGDLAMPSAVMLMPTPTVANWHGNEVNSRGDLLLPGAVREDVFGKYAPAIARWEQVTGRAAPAPREMNEKGNERLSPAFVEWMVGLPGGWVTGVPLARAEILRALGNIVVPQFATAITAELLAELGCPPRLDNDKSVGYAVSTSEIPRQEGIPR